MNHSGIRHRGVRAATAAAAIGLALLSAGPAGAQTKEELDQARRDFQEGVALSAANNCAAALTKFQAVVKVRRTPQVLFNIGECEERLGKLVSALGNFRLAAAAAEGDKKAKEVASRVGERIADLEARIPKLSIRRGEGAETATILLDGTELGAAEISAEIPVDPGSHAVVARVGDREGFNQTVSVEEKSTQTVDVVIEALPEETPPPVTAPVTPPPVAPPPDEGGSKTPGIVILSAGVVSGVVGGVFMGLRGGTLSDLDEMCGGDETCPPSAEDTADKGKLYTGLAEVTIALGVVGVATGIILLATSGSSAPEPAAESADPLARRKAARSARLFRPELRASAPGADLGGLSLVSRF